MRWVCFIIITFICASCTYSQKKKKSTKKFASTPYQAFFSKLDDLTCTDTILVQSQTNVFGCGTGAHEYYENLQQKGLDKFYEQYGDVLSDTNLLHEFEEVHDTKILWVFRGYEGELLEFNDSLLKKDTLLLNRLLKEKQFVKFNEAPNSMATVTITVSMVNPKLKETIIKTYLAGLKHSGWSATLVKNEKLNQKNFESGYHPF